MHILQKIRLAQHSMVPIVIFIIIPTVLSQASQWIDTFQKDLCRDRWSQMDWQSILRPCRFNLDYGKNKYGDRKRTSTKWSHAGLHFEKTGEYSKITLKTRTGDGRMKQLGGDTWRMFIRGADLITPFVSDLDNGVYEAKFIAMQPGFYKAEVVMESTLCESFKDPPQDWLKRDARTIITDEVNDKLVWEPLRGGNISFKIEEAPEKVIHGLKRSFLRWKDSCGPQYKCDMLWKGFGRWENSTWMPYIDDDLDPDSVEDQDQKCYRENEGVLKMTGDALTLELSYFTRNSSLCNEVFQRCETEMGGEQPDAQQFEKRDRSTKKKFTTKSYLHTLKELLKKDYMNEESGLLLNYGHPFVQNIGFRQYRSFIDRVVRIVKEKYKGKPLWRTMSTKWRDSDQPVDHFNNHQRIKLFNAYSTSAMCNAGIPVLDVFQMTESAPPNDKLAVIKNVERIILDYFKERPTKPCLKRNKIHKHNKLNEKLAVSAQSNSSNQTLNLTSTDQGFNEQTLNGTATDDSRSKVSSDLTSNQNATEDAIKTIIDL